MEHKHLDRNDRNQIEILLKRKYYQYEIAKVLKVHPTTIGREIKRYSRVCGTYCAQVAQHKADIRRRNSKHQGMKIEKNPELKKCIVDALENYQSPEAIAGRFGCISHMSIYKWLYSVYGGQYVKYLCSERYLRKKRKKRIPCSIYTPPVSQRPTHGIHWEGDLFVSPSVLHHSISVAMIVEQKSQYIRAMKIPNRRPSTMVSAVNIMTKGVRVDDITWDRGIENRYHTAFPVDSYFCEPGRPYEKPHVENNIGLIRKWFVPKGTDLSCMKQKQLDRYVGIINMKWRKSLGYRSATEVAKECGILVDDCV